MDREFIRKIIINYLHYNKGYDAGKATEIFDSKAYFFNEVIDILGDEFVIGILENIGNNN